MVLFTIGLMYSAFIAIGWLAARRLRDATTTEFMVAGRAMPLWLATATMTATWVDGGYLLGTAEAVHGSSLALGLQGGVCFGISLILGGLLFARRMRALRFNTLIDLFEARFGPAWAAVLSIPAMFAEMFWSAELLVALGSTFGVMLGLNLVTAIVLSAVVVIVYTMAGGMWSVAYTDALQLTLVAIGLAVAVPVALDAVGGLATAWAVYDRARPDILQPMNLSFWDVSLMLALGGIPWNCYFQRVLSCRSPREARSHSVLAGMLTVVLTIPPVLLGLVAFSYPWPADLAARLGAQPADAVPMIFRYLTPPVVGMIGLAAIIGAVTSSFSSSILSAGSMFSWNTCGRLLFPQLGLDQLKMVMRAAIAAVGLGAVWLAIEVQSVQALWFFTSDLVFVLLFPQLLYALFDSRANLVGSICAFTVSLFIRLAGGEPLLGLPPLLPYAVFEYKTVAAAAGVVVLPVVSRLTVTWSAPRAPHEKP